MELDRERTWRRGILGAILIALGVIFLMMNFGLWHYGRIDRLWPVVFFALALANLAAWTPRRVGSALFLVILGLWFLGCINGWYGMTYANSWSVLLVAAGLDMIVSGVLTHIVRRNASAGGRDSDHA